jgi:hypothetical protein
VTSFDVTPVRHHSFSIRLVHAIKDLSATSLLAIQHPDLPISLFHLRRLKSLKFADQIA